MKLFLLFGLSAVLILAACKKETTTQKMEYPVTEKSNQVDTIFGEAVADPYRWLENDTSDQTAAWVEAQNKVTFGFLDQISWRATLKKRLEALINYERISAPFREGEYEYFYRNTGLQNHSVLCGIL